MPGDGIDEAAAAFTADIAKETAPPPPVRGSGGGKKDVTEGPPERLFGQVGELEVDEESPPKGGGDDYGDPEVRTEEGDDGAEDAEEEAGEEAGEDEDEGGAGEEAAFYAQEVPVIIDGVEKNVTLKEALDGYVRTQTFHQRMNEVEEAKKIIKATAGDAVQNFEYSVSLAQQIEAHLDAMVPPEPNWDEEFKKSPQRAREMQKYYEQVKGFRAQLQNNIKEASVKMAESNSVQLRAYVQEEAKKFDNLNAKQWSTDPARKKKDLQAMRRTALTTGFSEDELSQVFDSRMLHVLLKASRYDRMMASKPKPVAKGQATKVIPSGGGPARTRAKGNGFAPAMKRLSKTGHIEDAAAVFDTILAKERK